MSAHRTLFVIHRSGRAEPPSPGRLASKPPSVGTGLPREVGDKPPAGRLNLAQAPLEIGGPAVPRVVHLEGARVHRSLVELPQ